MTGNTKLAAVVVALCALAVGPAVAGAGAAPSAHTSALRAGQAGVIWPTK